jgi:diadenosine tetraphosphate (Ap4A) HIT family hydrolase
MQQLHAYWRMDYIEAPRYPATMKRPFTELPAMGDDKAAMIVHRSRLSYLVLNRFPYNPGHLLAVPYREVVELEELSAAERADLMEEIVFAKRLLAAAMKPDGVNIGFNLGAAAEPIIEPTTIMVASKRPRPLTSSPEEREAGGSVGGVVFAMCRVRRGPSRARCALARQRPEIAERALPDFSRLPDL